MIYDDSIEVGSIVATKSYHGKYEIGGATYEIVDDSEHVAGDIECSNGLTARLRHDGTVDVCQFGAYADGRHDDADAINEALDSTATTIAFSNGTYLIKSILLIQRSGVTIEGNDSTITYDDDIDFSEQRFVLGVQDRRQFGVISDITVKKLTFDCQTVSVSQAHEQIEILRAKDVTIRGCRFHIKKHATEIANRIVTAIDMRNYWQNVTVDSCEIINTTDASEGGAIWVRAGEYGTGGFTLSNTYIEHRTHDEIIACFGWEGVYGENGGWIDGVIYEGNTFICNDSNINPHWTFLNFGAETDRIWNVSIRENTFDVLSGSGLLTPKNVNGLLFEGNTVNFRSICSGCATLFDFDGSTCNCAVRNNIISYDRSNGRDTYGDTLFKNVWEVSDNDIRIGTRVHHHFDGCQYVFDNMIDSTYRPTEQFI